MVFVPLSTEDASQPLAVLALGPAFVGWMLQVLISGSALQLAASCLKPGSGLSRRTRVTIVLVLLINLVVCGITFYEVVAWGTDQNRSINNIYSFKVGDAIVPLPAAVLAAIVQSFYSQRAWGILNRSIIFAIYIVLCILASLAGAIGLVVYSLRPQTSEEIFDMVFIFNEIWLWGSALTDTSISAALVMSLYKHKRSLLASTNRRSTETLLEKVMRIAMQTAAMTTICSAAAAIINVVTRLDASLSVYYCLQYPLPALYTYSYLFCIYNITSTQQSRDARFFSCPQCGHLMVEEQSHSSEGHGLGHFMVPVQPLPFNELAKNYEDDPEIIDLSRMLAEVPPIPKPARAPSSSKRTSVPTADGSNPSNQSQGSSNTAVV